MKNIAKRIAGMGCAIALTAVGNGWGQHSHAYAGDFNGDGYLDFGDPDTAAVTSTLETRTMAEVSEGVYAEAGYGFNGSWTPTALSGSDSAVPDPLGPLSGTFVRMGLYAVQGPAGATFGFFETGATGATISMETGQSAGAGSFALTEQSFFDDVPSDPFGHHHGRRFVATAAGIYTVTWVLLNSEAGGTLGSLANPVAGLQFFTQTWRVGTVTDPEPTPVPPTDLPGGGEIVRPSLEMMGSKRIVTSAERVTLRGTAVASGRVGRVEVKVAGERLRRARGREAWSFVVRLKQARTRVIVQAVGVDGLRSDRERVVIVRR